jgi:hypothetical protein
MADALDQLKSRLADIQSLDALSRFDIADRVPSTITDRTSGRVY